MIDVSGHLGHPIRRTEEYAIHLLAIELEFKWTPLTFAFPKLFILRFRIAGLGEISLVHPHRTPIDWAVVTSNG